MKASDPPLMPPYGSRAPSFSTASGSVVAFPVASTPTPSGSGRLAAEAKSTSPCDITLDAWSQTTGGADRRGQAKAMGLVPSTFRVPCHTTMRARVLTMVSAT